MDAVEALTRLGGVARAKEIVELSSRGRLRRSLRDGDIVSLGSGRYAFGVDDADARALNGVVSHLSAALRWGWQVKWPPDRPWVTVSRTRNISPLRRHAVNLVYAEVRDDVVDGVTAPLRTVIDCSRRLPFDEALAVADSALRSGDVTRGDLLAAADRIRGRGATQCRHVAAEATGKAANPFESVLRAIALEFPFALEPQRPVLAGGETYYPDLVDPDRCLVLEADSWRYHASRQGHARDCRRYNALALAGWLVLRFTWDQVMHAPHYVRAVLAQLPG